MRCDEMRCDEMRCDERGEGEEERALALRRLPYGLASPPPFLPPAAAPTSALSLSPLFLLHVPPFFPFPKVSTGQAWEWARDPVRRVPIIVTGNDFSTLCEPRPRPPPPPPCMPPRAQGRRESVSLIRAPLPNCRQIASPSPSPSPSPAPQDAPLVRDGRMTKFYWQPTRRDVVAMTHQMFSSEGVPLSDVEALVDEFPGRSLDFYGSLRARTYDGAVRGWAAEQGLGNLGRALLRGARGGRGGESSSSRSGEAEGGVGEGEGGGKVALEVGPPGGSGRCRDRSRLSRPSLMSTCELRRIRFSELGWRSDLDRSFVRSHNNAVPRFPSSSSLFVGHLFLTPFPRDRPKQKAPRRVAGRPQGPRRGPLPRGAARGGWLSSNDSSDDSPCPPALTTSTTPHLPLH